MFSRILECNQFVYCLRFFMDFCTYIMIYCKERVRFEEIENKMGRKKMRRQKKRKAAY